MAGTRQGALKGVRTKKELYGEDHFSRIGSIGGQKSRGRKRTPETKKKISATKKQRWNRNHTRLLEEGEADEVAS